MTLSNFLAISISGAAKIELMESESHKQKCELYTWNYVSWCNKRRALVRACVSPHDRLWKRGKTHVVHSQSDTECFFFWVIPESVKTRKIMKIRNLMCVCEDISRVSREVARWCLARCNAYAFLSYVACLRSACWFKRWCLTTSKYMKLSNKWF